MSDTDTYSTNFTSDTSDTNYTSGTDTSSDDSSWSSVSSKKRVRSKKDFFSCNSVLAIPFIVQDKKVYFLTVQDNNHKEWTFISGTVANGETCDKAVVRELLEETKGCIDVSLTNWNHKTFMTAYKIRNKLRYYKVYFIDITNIKPSSMYKGLELKSYNSVILSCFKHSQNNEKSYNENSDIDIETLGSFQRKHKWDFMNVILEHQEFKKIMKTL